MKKGRFAFVIQRVCDLPPSIRRKVYMILRNEEECYVQRET